MRKIALTFALCLALFMLLAGTALAGNPPKPLRLVAPKVTTERLLHEGYIGPFATAAEIEAATRAYLRDWRAKHPDIPNPRAAQRVAQNEIQLVRDGISPKAAGTAVQGELRLLTVLVEFAGSDTFVDYYREPFPERETECVTDTVTMVGPMHNEIPAPGPRDNNTLWLEDFSPDFYNAIVYTTEGWTERIRPDLTGADGLPGIDISGKTFVNYYDEVSGGEISITGDLIGWITVTHSEAYYGATLCGGSVAGNGHPDNPRFPSGVGQLVVDVVDRINELYPDFDWPSYDTDGDGLVDHLLILHAGKDYADGGGAQGSYAIWSHSGSVDDAVGGYVVDDRGTPEDPSDDIRVLHYTMMPEDNAIGVWVHEFGHDLGLPDVYDVTGGGDADPNFWELMNTGSHSGELFGTWPANLSAWCKMVLGWNEPYVIDYNSPAETLRLGQRHNPPADTLESALITLPDQVVQVGTPYAGTYMAWSNNDADWADYRLWKDIDLSGYAAGTEILFTFYTDYVIEEDWDFAFIEVSTDGGATWVQLPDLDGITTPDDYPDPNGRLHDYGDLKYGITGSSDGWIQMRFDLSAYAGQNIRLSFRYCTDAAYLDIGMFVDNIELLADGVVFDSEDFETGDLGTWTNTPGAFPAGVPGAGWIVTDGTMIYPHYYMLEWVNADGFDEGVKWAYSTSRTTDTGIAFFFDPEEWMVDRVPYNAPGMLLWYRNTAKTVNAVNATTWEGPSMGPKGYLLLVDSHYDPVRWPVDPAAGQLAGLVMPGRAQSYNIAFNKWGTDLWESAVYAPEAAEQKEAGPVAVYTVGGEAAVPEFHDSLGYYPGLGMDAQYRLYYVDRDASVTIPSVENQVYTTKFRTWPGLLDVLQPFWGLDLWGDGLTILGPGDPAYSGVAYGVNLEVAEEDAAGTWADVNFYNYTIAFDFGVSAEEAFICDTVTYNAEILNNGVESGTPTCSIVLPTGVEIDEASLVATAGTATYDAATRTISWSGTLAGGESAVISFDATFTKAAEGLVEVEAVFNDGVSGMDWPKWAWTEVVRPPCNAVPKIDTYSGPVGAFFDQSDMSKVYFGVRLQRRSETGMPDLCFCKDEVQLFVGDTEVEVVGEEKHEFSKSWAGPPGYDFWAYVFGPYTVDTVGRPLPISLVVNGSQVWTGNLRPNAVLNLNELYVFSGLYQDIAANPSPGIVRLYAFKPWQEDDPVTWVSGVDYDVWEQISDNVTIPGTGYWALSYRNELADLVDQIKLGYLIRFVPPTGKVNVGPSVLNRFGRQSPNNPDGIEFWYVWPALYGGNVMQRTP
ncbi:MAG: immune inhibitor A [Chloroflexi bacterium]|nr:immune inhibitor A [Chloroflexota bacterium]